MFKDKIGQSFVIEEAGSPAIPLTLTEATPMRNYYAKATRDPFSLIFIAQGNFILPQRMYPLRHETLGLQTIFLVPIGRTGDTTSYQAIFN
jgi:hypothetical protein